MMDKIKVPPILHAYFWRRFIVWVLVAAMALLLMCFCGVSLGVHLYQKSQVPIFSYFLIVWVPIFAVGLHYALRYGMIFISPPKSLTWTLIANHNPDTRDVLEDLQTVFGEFTNGYFLTDQYILIAKGNGVMIRPLSQLIWVFEVSEIGGLDTTYDRDYIQFVFDDEPFSPNRFRHNRWTYFRCEWKNGGSEVLSEIQSRHPQMLFGFSKKLLKEASQDFEKFCTNIRQLPPEELKAMQPECVEKAVIWGTDLMQ